VLIPSLREAVGPEGEVLGVDFSAEMLKGAARKEARRAVLLWAQAQALPLIDGCLDTIVCFAAFPHFHDKAQVAREFSRTLRPGGRAYVAHLGSRDEINVHHDRHPAVAGDHMPSPDGMRALFTAAGFSRTHLEERPGWYRFTAEKEATQ
jgi:ubiquinone/menaquinone biosynthesis C-methylase UbiE